MESTKALVLSSIDLFLSMRRYIYVETVAAADIGIDKINTVIIKKIIPSINPAI